MERVEMTKLKGPGAKSHVLWSQRRVAAAGLFCKTNCHWKFGITVILDFRTTNIVTDTYVLH